MRRFFALLLGVSLAAAAGSSAVTPSHARTLLSHSDKPHKCHAHGYKSAHCAVAGPDQEEPVPVPGLAGVDLVVPPQGGNGVQVEVANVANPCSEMPNAEGVRILVTDPATGKEKKLHPPAHLNKGTIYQFNPATGTCSPVKTGANGKPEISSSGLYAVVP